MSVEDFNDALLFLEDDELEENVEAQTTETWHILIVDDDTEIHAVTKLALSGLNILDKNLTFGHAYSGQQAIEYVASHSDIAVILMDVVMESDNAGLEAIKHIREVLNKQDIRIILRTGQPGCAPEEEVIQKYDINDYKTKTELTRIKLLTALVAALRCYQQLNIINKSKTLLEGIIQSTALTQQQKTPQLYAETTLVQLLKLLSFNCDAIFLSQDSNNKITISAALNQYTNYQYKKLEDIDSGRIISQVSQTFNQKKHLTTSLDTCLYIETHNTKAAIYLNTTHCFEHISQTMIDLFLNQIAIGLENICLLDKISETAYIDKLTQLPNRSRFIKYLDQYVEQQTNQTNNQVAAPSTHNVIALIDIIHFSDVNDGLGHNIGDGLLIACANRLNEHYKNKCIVARVSPDVFGLIGHDSEINIDNINFLFNYPLTVNEHQISVAFKTGFCQQSPNERTGLIALKHAEIALNEAKKDIQCKYVVYDEVLEHKTAWRLGMLHQLQADFLADKLEVWFQPQLDLHNQTIMGFEALLRWPRPNGDMISPDIFVPLAEYSGLIVEMGTWVIEEACRQLKQLEEKGLPNIRVSINVSMVQFKDSDFVDRTIGTIKQFNVNPKHIELEITESVLMNNPNTVIDAMNRLKAYGLQVALDDFGTGFSSLSYLRELPLDRMKVDKAFVKDMDHKNGEMIVEMVLSLGQKLGLHTIAEGVEHPDQATRLTNMGCEEVQGFLYAKPLPAEQLHAFALKYKPK